MDGTDPRQVLARRLRALREEHWPDMKITQPQLAQALGGAKPLSVPLISSWESQANPKIPPVPRLEAYAALFATQRSFEGKVPHRIGLEDMTDEERRAMGELKEELLHLRSSAMGVAHDAGSPGAVGSVAAARLSVISESLSSGPWRYEDGNAITVVCAEIPADMLATMPYTNVNDPDYIDLLTFSELDSLVELFGHLRAANPANQVNFQKSNRLTSDDYSSHLVSLGGVDWNEVTMSMLFGLQLPVRQVANWNVPDGQYFEVEKDGRTFQYRPVLEQVGDRKMLREDVALFARAVNPFNRKRGVTVCSGMYGRGTYGAVRALTDAAFRDRNADFVESHFGNSESYCILTRVQIVNGATLTPDWTIDDNRLFEWSAGANV
jgi:hypothetical protein